MKILGKIIPAVNEQRIRDLIRSGLSDLAIAECLYCSLEYVRKVRATMLDEMKPVKYQTTISF